MRRAFGSAGALTVLAFLLGGGGPLLAQQGTAQISGRVSDNQGGVLPGVSLVITNEATGLFREVTSSTDGTFFVSQLVPGTYRILARLEGFRPTEQSGYLLQVGTTLTVSLELEVGGIQETLTVSPDRLP